MYRKEYQPLFTDKTFENILNERLKKISNDIDKREGSIVYDAHAPSSIEESIIYAWLDYILKNAYGNTANRFYLEQRALERGIEPYPATPSVIIGKFNTKIDINQRFECSDVYFFVTAFKEKKDGFYYYELTCEETGKIGNIRSGALSPLSTVRGLRASEIYKLAVLGEEVEDTEDFRDRYFETIRNNAYGGNIADYIQKTRGIPGVGLVKVIPVWNGGGTVKVIITDSEYGEPTKELVEKVQEILDPVPLQQRGVGVAPIGHLVTVEGVARRNVDISVDLLLEEGTSIEYVRKKAREKAENLFKDLRNGFAKRSASVGRIYEDIDVRRSHFLCLFLNTEGVKDYDNLLLDGTTNKVIHLEDNEIPFIGKFDIKKAV